LKTLKQEHASLRVTFQKAASALSSIDAQSVYLAGQLDVGYAKFEHGGRAIRSGDSANIVVGKQEWLARDKPPEIGSLDQQGWEIFQESKARISKGRGDILNEVGRQIHKFRRNNSGYSRKSRIKRTGSSSL
jgi:hypothetical protein